MQKLIYRKLLSIGCLAVFLSGCVVNDEQEQARLLKHVFTDYELLYECANGICSDYNKSDEASDSDEPIYMFEMISQSSKGTNTGGNSFDIEIENSFEVISCINECVWHIGVTGTTYLMTVEHVEVCDKAKSDCRDNDGSNYHGEKGAGNHEHILYIVFFNVLDPDNIPKLDIDNIPPRSVVYSVSHKEDSLAVMPQDFLRHRSTHGGGIDSNQ